MRCSQDIQGQHLIFQSESKAVFPPLNAQFTAASDLVLQNCPGCFHAGAVPSHAEANFIIITAIYVQEAGGGVLTWCYVYFIPHSISLHRRPSS
jgi:hypothetical protein